MELCPCGSEKNYSECCEPIILKTRNAETAEELMRSRYSAYVKTNVDYILTTMLPDERSIEEQRESIKKWSENSVWEKLEIINTKNGNSEDKKGTVEFKAYYTSEGKKEIHHELASFEKRNGQWIFIDGKEAISQVINVEPKIGRNDPCPCGSGKKYKKCCGK